MGLRLSSKVKKEPTTTGFDINFVDGKSYNLEEILANKSRVNSKSPLIIEVKESRKIGAKALESVKADLSNAVNSNLNDEDVITELTNIIEGVAEKYNIENNNFEVGSAAFNRLNFEVNKYLTKVYERYGTYSHDLDFWISINGSDKFQINYSFANNEDFTKEFYNYYNQYLENYTSELKNVSEGGLAISDRKDKIRINRTDYGKYLLDREGASYENSDGFVNSQNCSGKVNIMWENGETDTTAEYRSHSIYEEYIEMLQKYEEAYADVLSTIGSIQAPELDSEGVLNFFKDPALSDDGLLKF